MLKLYNRFVRPIRTMIKCKYSFNYLIDAWTLRKLKMRAGKCNQCGNCCRLIKGGYCEHIEHRGPSKPCKIYNHRNCNISFPVNQEELDHFYKVITHFGCSYYFKD